MSKNEDNREDTLPLLALSDYVAAPVTRLRRRTWYLGACLGALGLLFVVTACSNRSLPNAHSIPMSEFGMGGGHSRPATLARTSGIVKLNKLSNSSKGQGSDKVGHAASDKVDKGSNSITHVPPTMHLVHRDFSKHCSPPQFQCISEQIGPTPLLQQGAALIKVRASAVTHDDTSEKSLYREYFTNITLGQDASGTVLAVAEDCTHLKVGDHVWSTFPVMTRPAFYGSGALAEYATVLCSCTGIAPSSIDLGLAGTLPTVALTSLGALQSAGAPWTSKDFTVLIAAGTGGTGYSAVQLAKAFGATKVVTAAGHDDGVSFVKSLGADVVVDYHTKSVFDAIPDGSVDFFFDNLGVDVFRALKKLKSPGGVFISIANWTPSMHLLDGTRLEFYGLSADLPKFLGNLDILANLIDTGRFKVVVDQTYELDQIKDAYSRMLQGGLKSRIGIDVEKSGQFKDRSS